MESWQSTPPFPPQFWPPPPQSQSSYRHFTGQHQPITQGRISPWFEMGCNVEWFEQGMGRAYGNVGMSYNVHPDILRALEKEKIREEILASERRRELEAEVREELRIEREMAFRMKGGNAFDRFGVPVESWGRTETSGMNLLPFQRQKEKIIFVDKHNVNKHRSRRAHALKAEKSTAGFIGLGVHQELKAKPTVNLSGRKRKFESAAKVNIPEVSGGGNKRGKKARGCDHCQVSPSSEASLNDHLGGMKHQAMEDAMISKKMEGENTGAGILLLPKIPEVPISEVSLNDHLGGKKRQAIEDAMSREIVPKIPEVPISEEVSEVSLNDHLGGKKHQAMEDAMPREILPKIPEVPISEEVSEVSFNDHLGGKKHQAMEDAMSREILPKIPEVPISEEVSEVSLKDHLGGKKHQALEDAMSREILPKIPEVPISEEVTPKGEKKAWRCEVCQVCTPSKGSLDNHLSGKKHKAVEDALSRKKLEGENTGTGIVPISEEVTPKREKKAWICDLCQIYAPTEASLNDHLRGKKHMAVEDALSRKKLEGENTPKITEVPISEEVTPKKLIASTKRRLRKFKGAQKMYKYKFPFWCEMCQTGANSETSMVAHRKGKKHSHMLKFELGA